MERLSKNDVREIVEMIEDELSAIPKLDRIQRMKMRAKIRQQENWLLAYGNPTVERISTRLQGRLSEIFNLCSHGFSEKLDELLKLKLKYVRET